MQFDPKFATAHHMLAIVKAAQDNIDSAINLEEKAIALDPQNPDFKALLKKLQSKRRGGK